MKVSELGEFGLIDLLAKIVAERGEISQAWQRLYLGIGDDAAAWQCDTSLQLATTDTLVQDVHFVLGYTTWEQLVNPSIFEGLIIVSNIATAEAQALEENS